MSDSAHWGGANNLITTVGDYAAFVVSVMKEERLTKAMADERFRPASGPQPPFGCKIEPASRCPRALNFALGWIRLDYEDGPVMAFLGMNDRIGGAERTLVYFDPQKRSGVVVLTSGRNGQRLLLDVVEIVEPGSPVAAFLRSR